MIVRRVDKHSTVMKMADSLMDAAIRQEVSLKGITKGNFNTFLDDLFKDGGEVRCEKFADLAFDYSLQFGELETTLFDRAQWECIVDAIEEVRKRVGT